MVFHKLVGAEIKRKEDPRLITGKGTYTGNLSLPGMHHVMFVRSPFAHARIGAIDASAALAIPGVVAVVTGEDLKDLWRVELPVEKSDTVNKNRSRYPLAVGRVRHVGEAVAVVIAKTAEAATDAVSEVYVDWDLLPVVATLEQATEEGAQTLFDSMSDNIYHSTLQKEGDVEAAFAQADHVVKQRMISQRLAAVSMEPRAVVAAPDFASEGLTVWSSTQTPHYIRTDIAKSLGFSQNLIRVIAPDVGGGFGVKIGIYAEEVVMAALALRFQVPVRWIEDRLEDMQVTTHGRAQIAEYELALKQDGMIGLRADVQVNLGAYPMALYLADLTTRMACGVYHIPAVEIFTRSVATNTTPVAAYRGAGRPEAAYYIERMVEIAAQELGLDPIEIRRKNFIPPTAFPYDAPTGSTYDSGDYEKPLNRALELANYDELRAEQAQRDNSETLMGIGISSFVEVCAEGPFESAIVRVEPTGSVTVFTGIMPQGQGQATTFAQIIADELGADYERITVKYGDTATTPAGSGTYGHDGLVIGGMSMVRAAEVVRDKARVIAAHLLEAATEDIVLENGRYQVRGVPSSAITLSDIADRAYSDKLPDDIASGLEATDFYRPIGNGVYPFGAHIAVVEVERDTGIIHLRDYVSVDDCGPRISPMLVEGQVHGGLAQGIAQALFEEVVYSEDGQMLTGTLMDYAIPRSDSFPQFRTGQTVTPTPLNPMGVKGIGELATIGSTPAVVNAVLDALKPFGVKHIDMPLRPEKIWRAMRGE